MISKLELQNFKLHRETSIEAAPITVLIGPNNSGKSSVFQALLSLKQAALRATEVLCVPAQMQQPLSILDIGDFKDIVRQGQSEIQIHVEGTICGRTELTASVRMEVGFDIHVRDNRLVYHKGSLEFSGATLPWEYFPVSTRPCRVSLDGAVLEFNPRSDFRLLVHSRSGIPADLPPHKKIEIGELSRYIEQVPLRLLDSAHPIFPLRGFEEWGYSLPDSRADNLERLTLADRAMATASILAYDRPLTQKLSLWLEELLQVGIQVELLPPKRVVIRCKPVGEMESNRLFANEGTGANQLPFILI